MIAHKSCIVLAALASILAGGSRLRAADAYQVDGVHSAAVFKVKHLNVSNAHGRFNEISGKVAIDPADAKKSSIDIEVKAESVDTGNAKRDQHLKGPDFFGVKQFPTISFKSSEVKKVGETTFEAKGQLTLHGVTKDITVKIEQTGSGKDPFGSGKRAGFESNFTVKRSDYGMKLMQDAIGDEVSVTISIECTSK